MSLRKSSRLFIALPFIALGTYGAAHAAPPADITTRPACTVSADTVVTGQPNLMVNVRLTEEIGDTITVTIAPDAKLVVASVQKGKSPMTADVLLNSEQATVGDWNVTLNGKSGTCTGTLSVAAVK
ncbi:MAG: hypothetical protein H7Z40_19670 [Phycisphaerae bacterium]|nr:hypothetical protein [Gemmatimonadaceae bacterium]